MSSYSSINRFEYHDNFGLAVLIFQLLMDGNHPFMGVPQDLQQSFGKVDQHCIKQGIFPYQSNRGFLPPPHAPRFESLHPDLQNLFVQTFVSGFKTPTTRTEALDWVHAIETAENALTQCQRNPAHWYSNHSSKCHWCEREKPGNIVPIQKPLTPSASTPVPQPPVPVSISQVIKAVVSSLPFPLWQVAALIVLSCFALFLGGLGARIFSTISPVTSTATETVVEMPLAVTEVHAVETKTPLSTTEVPVVTAETPLAIREGLLSASEAKMVLIPEGEFIMGSDDKEANDDEKPLHKVTLSSYYIDQYEVTNAEYKRCVDVGVCSLSIQNASPSSYGGSAYYSNPEFSDYPVMYVNWSMANIYCTWRGARLPTEAEWEKAARGTSGYVFPWGNTGLDCSLANYLDEKTGQLCAGNTTKVGSYEMGKSPYGVYDMIGNVYEFVNDWYSEIHYQNSPSINPLGPDSGNYRVLRGGWAGGYDGTMYNVHSAASRNWIPPNEAFAIVGFRCARSP